MGGIRLRVPDRDGPHYNGVFDPSRAFRAYSSLFVVDEIADRGRVRLQRELCSLATSIDQLDRTNGDAGGPYAEEK